MSTFTKGFVLDVTVVIKTFCPLCGNIDITTVGSIPEEIDISCGFCKKYYTCTPYQENLVEE